MVVSVDLNADLGEGIGNDEALLDIVSSANVACGLHAGDPVTMGATIRAAQKRGVRIGAHPGFDDFENFGRTRMTLDPEELTDLIRYQVGAINAMVTAEGAQLSHLKLHGALANMASEDETLARHCYEAALSVVPDLPIMTIAATAQERAAHALGATYVNEIFADRAYNDDATLVDRKQLGAVLHDASEVARRILDMLSEGAIIAQSGKRIETRIDTICLHGDTEEAVELARALRDALTGAGLTIRAHQ